MSMLDFVLETWKDVTIQTCSAQNSVSLSPGLISIYFSVKCRFNGAPVPPQGC